jgi:hypothetical protein
MSAPEPMTPAIGTRVTIYRGSHRYTGTVTAVFVKYCSVEFTRKSGKKETVKAAVYTADTPFGLIPDGGPAKAIVNKFQG